MNRYNDYYLVNDEDIDIEDSVEYRIQSRKCTRQKVMWVCLSILFLLLLGLAIVFVGFPLLLMNSRTWQQKLVFTHFNLPEGRFYYEDYRFAGFKNHYVTVKDVNTEKTLELGLWHILPLKLAEEALVDDKYDYDGALKNSNYSVLLYFHGTGEDRSQSQRKYQLLRYFFHIIAFDYRSYGDSSAGNLYEKNVVHDCVQVYRWLQNRTDAPIYVWGHSLGTALATSTVAQLEGTSNTTGLILEAPFTTFKEELYNHPVTKWFKWLPWFESTIVKPLEKSGFIFDTSKHILDINCPIMFLHARDDKTVPYFMSEKLYEISQKRHIDEEVKNKTTLILFDEYLGLNHNWIYQDPYLIFYVYGFMKNCSNGEVNFLANSRLNEVVNFYEGSHQS